MLLDTSEGVRRDLERRGMLNQGEELVGSSTGRMTGTAQTTAGNWTGFPQRNLGVLSGISSGLGYYAGQQNLNTSLAMQKEANKYSMFGGLMGAAGLGIGAASAVSTPKMKKNIKVAGKSVEEAALKNVKQAKSHSFNYKGESAGTPKRVGPMTTELPANVKALGGNAIDVQRMMGMQHAATRALARKVDKLERKGGK
jgi:hypothetical protein